MSFLTMALWISLTDIAAIRHVADDYLFTYVVGDQPKFTAHARELFLGVPLRRPIKIPPRQNFSVLIERKSTLPSEIEPFELCFHLDGLLTMEWQ